VSKDNQVHVANNTDQTIYVMVTPNPAYAFADFGFKLIETAVLAVLTGDIKVKDVVEDLRDLMTAVQALNTAKKAAQIASQKGEPVDPEDQQAIDDNYASTIAYLQENAFQIGAHNFMKVSDIGLLNPMKYLTPSAWAAICGGSDLSLFLATETLDRYAMFNTNSDDSWIFNANDVTRSTYGTIWQQNPGDGFYRMSIADRLPAGSYLQPGESLASNSGEYNFVYQADGNAVLYRRDGARDVEVPWNTHTNGEPAWRTYQQVDGNFVVYSADGHAAWASDVYGSGAEYEGSKLVMQDDGNLVVYTTSGRPIWASNDHR
jgi:hypothetical protein